MLRHLLLALVDAVGRDGAADILGVGQREFGLAIVEVDDLLVGRQALEGTVRDRSGHALANRIGLDVLQAVAKAAILRLCRRDSRRDREAAEEHGRCGEGL